MCMPRKQGYRLVAEAVSRPGQWCGDYTSELSGRLPSFSVHLFAM